MTIKEESLEEIYLRQHPKQHEGVQPTEITKRWSGKWDREKWLI